MENINKLVKSRTDNLINSNKDFESIFNICFSNPDYIISERNDGFQIYETTFGQAKKLIDDAAYSLNKKYNIKDEYIGLALDNSLSFLVGFWTILKSGNKPYLVNLRHPKVLSNNIFNTLNIKYVLGDKDYEYNAQFININDLNESAPIDYKYTFANQMCLSTSATTLKEKIIFFTGQELSAQILNVNAVLKINKQAKKHYKGKLKLLAFLPLYHIFGFVATYMWFSFFGRTLVFLNDYSANTILNTIKKHEVTHVFGVPLFWNTVEKEILKNVKSRDEKTQKKFYSGIDKSLKLQQIFGLNASKRAMHEITDNLFGKSVLFCISGGSYIKDETIKLFNSLGYPLYNGYGMSEIGITSVELGNTKQRLLNSIGKPFESVEYKIVDNELLVKGASISHQMMIDGKLITIDDWYKTNDLVHMDKTGRYYIDGRKDDLFIGANGENINPDMIEKLINITKAKRYSILSIDNKLSLIIEIAPNSPKSLISNIYNEAKAQIDMLDSSLRVNKIYLTFDPIQNENAIKVSRQYVLNNINKGLIKLSEIDNIDLTNQEVDESIIKTVSDCVAKLVTKDNIDINANIFFDLELTSLDYFSLISDLNNIYNIDIDYSSSSLQTIYDLSKEIERVINL